MRGVIREYAALLIIGVLTFACRLGGEPKVRVVNHSTAELRNIVLSGRGFSVKLPSVPPGAIVEAAIAPRGESGLAVSFEAAGRRIAVPEQGYVENFGGYVMTVEVKPDLSVAISTTVEGDEKHSPYHSAT